MHIMGPYCNKKHTIEYQRCLFVLEHRGTAQKKNNNFAFNQVGCRVTEDRRTKEIQCVFDDIFFLLKQLRAVGNIIQS